MKTTYYIDNDAMLAELIKWRDSSEDPEQRQPSEELGKMLIAMHEGIMKHGNFRNYRQDLKEEMQSYSLYRIFKCGLKSFKFDGTSTPFAYFTRSIFLNYYTVLSRYYRRLNSHEQYVKGCLLKLKDQGVNGIDKIMKAFGLNGL